MAERSKITVALFDQGVTVRVEGPGTLCESRVVHAFAERSLAESPGRLVIDLSACTYIDSTFLGGLVSLHKRHGPASGDRFAIHAPAKQRQMLFGVSRLDRVLCFVDDLPVPLPDNVVTLEVQSQASKDELAEYVVDCHRRLAELGEAEAREYGGVADAIQNELAAARRRN